MEIGLIEIVGGVIALVAALLGYKEFQKQKGRDEEAFEREEEKLDRQKDETKQTISEAEDQIEDAKHQRERLERERKELEDQAKNIEGVSDEEIESMDDRDLADFVSERL